MQYSKAFVAALQFMWGEGFLSPGGPEEVAALLQGEDLRGRRVLDIGSGVGGVDALLVTRHGADEVVGTDVEFALVAEATARVAAKGLSHRICFVAVDPGPLPFADECFDLVLSKDSMVHIADKSALYREVLRVLKPGCPFVASDWLWVEGAASSPTVLACRSAFEVRVHDTHGGGPGDEGCRAPTLRRPLPVSCSRAPEGARRLVSFRTPRNCSATKGDHGVTYPPECLVKGDQEMKCHG